MHSVILGGLRGCVINCLLKSRTVLARGEVARGWEKTSIVLTLHVYLNPVATVIKDFGNLSKDEKKVFPESRYLFPRKVLALNLAANHGYFHFMVMNFPRSSSSRSLLQICH
ncbi:hypothetical protein PUN28_006814 [Cardiocondyla obscurior]|uniref:Uncharacterized protein n=1 Tax=Cardiocondyla obscurior TaxID=286306 RepID=A0AAW2G2T7_9HYME